MYDVYKDWIFYILRFGRAKKIIEETTCIYVLIFQSVSNTVQGAMISFFSLLR
jgi:hypothetical protein